MSGVCNLDDHGIDHRKVQSSWHTVVKERWVHHLARVIEEILFIECPAYTLNRPTLHLSFDIAWVNRFARILDCRKASDISFAGLSVDGYVCKMNRVSVSFACWVNIGATRNGSTGCRKLAGQVFKGELQFLI